ncbi:MAG: Ig-like domain-containing protein [Acidobacteria bacterium]|nr:Ig-like domain-containing protein [Acidobacteriota bacterium]
MRRKFFAALSVVAILLANFTPAANAQQGKVKTVEVTPNNFTAEVGQQIKFTAVAKDENGKVLELKVMAWFAGPFDIAGADENGNVTMFDPGTVKIGAVVGGKVGYAVVNVKPASVKRIEIDAPLAPIVVGGATQLNATARTLNGDPRSEVMMQWSSSNPAVAVVDAAGVVTGIKPGKATLQASADAATGKIAVEVITNPVNQLAIEPKSSTARTGDVVRFKVHATGLNGAQIKHPAVRWSVSGTGALIYTDGGFVAENPGTYIITAISGKKIDTASVVVAPRNIERAIEVVGRAPIKDFMGAEQWIIGDYAYYSTISNKLLVYDISDPAHPKKTDSIEFDAHILNDISTTPDGKIAVLSREGASNRKNGIVFLDTSDPAHPKKLSEYTATVTGGVHSAFVDSHYVYLTDDATGSLRVIDFQDVKNPKEVARWQAETVVATPVSSPNGFAGRYLHDVQVLDGLAYLAYWRDGLIILDVGNGIKGGSPEKPVRVSQYRFNHHELYGDGWLAGAHAVFRYKNYVFVGDEVFPTEFNLMGKERFPVRGIAHVIDVSDLQHPRKVAEYAVPEGGSHNIWVKDDMMYMGYYSAGGRVVDVSGELRGDLYKQGREIARVWTGALEGFRSNQAFCWGAQPHKDLIFFNDVNTGLWITKLAKPKYKGSTTAPGN